MEFLRYIWLNYIAFIAQLNVKPVFYTKLQKSQKEMKCQLFCLSLLSEIFVVASLIKFAQTMVRFYSRQHVNHLPVADDFCTYS